MEYISNIKFDVSPDAVLAGLMNGEVQAIESSRVRARRDKSKFQETLKRYEDLGVFNAVPSISEFRRTHPSVFRNPKLVNSQGNIFEDYMAIAPLSGTSGYEEKLKSRMTIGRDVSEEEIEKMGTFFTEYQALVQKPDVQEKIEETKQYRRAIERVWKSKGKDVIKHIEDILGYEPETVGKESHVYIMYPNYNIHRSGNGKYLFFGKKGEDLDNRVLSHLSHQVIHQQKLPYTIGMTEQTKEKFHCFIKFLTDKETYRTLSHKSALAITTPRENHALMAKVYPYWLGYKYRNSAKEGIAPAEAIRKEIQEDKEYFDSLPEKSKEREIYRAYDFDNLSPEKIADFFRYKKSMGPYDFVRIDFDNRDAVCRTKISPNHSERKKVQEKTL